MSVSRRLEVLGGAGTVSREGPVVVWLAAGFPTSTAAELVECAGSVGAAAGASTLAEALAEVAGTASSAFGVVVESGDHLVVVLNGHVVASEDGIERLRGADGGLASADLGEASSLTVRGDTDLHQLDRPGALAFDLHAGIVPGGGFTFWSGFRPRPVIEPELSEKVVLFDLSAVEERFEPLPVASLPVVPEPVSDEAAGVEAPVPVPGVVQPAPEPVPAAGAGSADAGDGAATGAAVGASQQPGATAALPATEAAPPPAPPKARPGRPGAAIPETEVTERADGPSEAVEAPAEEAEGAGRQPMVRGINCARGHFNNPQALYCGICGLAMVQNSVILVEGVRPPLGVLLMGDGTAYSLDGDYILGREPNLSPDVASGAVRAIKVDDGTGKISRLHAKVSLKDWDVIVTDLGSHNGTSVFNPGDPSWTTLRPEDPLVLRPGGRIVIGQSTFEFQSIQRH